MYKLNLALSACVVILICGTIYLAIRLYRTEKMLQCEREEKHHAQLCFLNLQTKPHFLTNCLSIIYSLTLENENELALKMVSYLSREMQYRFATRGSFVTVRDELARVENYLKILQIRFPDAVEVDYQIDNRTLDSYVSPFSLQPLVDNCIKHGRIAGACIHIEISCFFKNDGENRLLEFTVKDDGRGMSPEQCDRLNNNIPREWKLKTRHVGIENLKFRFHLLYGQGKTTIHFSSLSPSGTVVTLLLPDKTEYQPPEEDNEDE